MMTPALRFAVTLAISGVIAGSNLVGCGHPAPTTTPPPAGGSGDDGTIGLGTPAGTPLQHRQRKACVDVALKLTACAVEDARATMSPEEFAKTTTPEITRKNTAEYNDKCQAATMSSRQVRVLEVCFRQEQACEPLLACLEHLKPEASER
jgi:hypothetical protein